MSLSTILNAESELNNLYCGRRLKDDINLEEVDGMDWEDGDMLDGTEYDEEPAVGEDGKPLPVWSRYQFEVDYRSYLEKMDTDDDYAEDDERQYWNLTTLIYLEVTDRVITGIEIGCNVTGDSALGEEDPDEVWADKDLDLVADLMEEILEEDPDIAPANNVDSGAAY